MRRLFLAGGQAGLTNQLEPGCLAWAWAVPRKKKKKKKKKKTVGATVLNTFLVVIDTV